MKKGFRIFGIMLLLLTVVITTVACSKGDEAPDGMQTVRGGEEYGFYMYAPAEWTVANHGNIAAAYTSKIDNSSVTFTEAEAPANINEYFATEMKKLPFEITLSKAGEKCSFGNAKEAYKYIFSYTYDELPIRCMQILVKYDSRFYIFTYTSYDTERREGESYYDYYLESVQKVIDSFKLVEKKPAEGEVVEYEKDGDGYILISDRRLAGFDMYVPADYRVVDSSAIVSAVGAGGENVNISRATYSGVYFDKYWEHRSEELSRIVDKVTGEDGGESSSLTLLKEGAINRDDLDTAYFYEYKYTLFGQEYRVYQAFLVDGYDGYVFTYTAKADLYEGSLDTAMRILAKAKF